LEKEIKAMLKKKLVQVFALLSVVALPAIGWAAYDAATDHCPCQHPCPCSGGSSDPCPCQR